MIALHNAGRFDEVSQTQACTRCGKVLCDYSGGQVLAGSPPLHGFEPGPVIEHGNSLYVPSGAALREMMATPLCGRRPN